MEQPSINGKNNISLLSFQIHDDECHRLMHHVYLYCGWAKI